jgi:NAD-dependent deacetylase
MTVPPSFPARYPGRLLPDSARLRDLIELTAAARRIVAFTGAGISTESGIPDYRGPGGLWSTGKPPTLADFLESEETRRDYWRRRRETYPELMSRQPNAGHLALAALERAGRLSGVITQNIDGLHQRAGVDAGRVVELHGTAHQVRCVSCEHREPALNVQQRQDAGDELPVCPVCNGAMRSATVLFGEAMPSGPLRQAVELASSCDLMLVIGSSLVVQPAAKLPLLARQAGANLGFVNREETPLDHHADVVVLADAGPVLSAVADAVTRGDQAGWQARQR